MRVWFATSLSGGVSGALDFHNGNKLSDEDLAMVNTGTAIYFFNLDADSGLAESSPDVIAPDTNAGNKRWILIPSTSLTGAQVKALYEAESDTNAYTDAEKSKLAGIASGATVGDSDAVHDNVSGEIAALTEKASPVSGDHLLIEDSEAGNVKKRIQIGNLPSGTTDHGELTGLGDDDHTQYHNDSRADTWLGTKDQDDISDGTTYVRTENNFTDALKSKLDGIESSATADQTGTEIKAAYEAESDTNAYTDAEKTKLSGIAAGATVGDPDAIHNNEFGEISSLTEKTTPAGTDLLLIEDATASYGKKKIQLSNLPSGSGTDSAAIHTDTSAEISALTEKASPVSADLIVIEDSDASNAKKKVQIGNLPSGSNDHGGLSGLGDDDHTQYHNDSRADTWLGTKDQDDIPDGATYVRTENNFTDALKSKLNGIEANAEVNNISETNVTDLTDGGDSSLHYHSADRNRANQTGTQPASTISDFDTEVGNNTTVTGKLDKSGGIMTGQLTARDHGTASVDEVVNVCYGTGSPPAASGTTEGTIFIKYEA